MIQVANNYSHALYELALEESATEEFLSQLNMISSIFDENDEYVKILNCPVIDIEERFKILDEAFNHKIHNYILNFMKVLMENNNLLCFTKCVDAFLEHYDKDNNIERVVAITAVPISEELKEKLIRKTEKFTGKTIILTNSVQPDCMGGVILRFNDRQIDGSVKTHLENMKQKIFSIMA